MIFFSYPCGVEKIFFELFFSKYFFRRCFFGEKNYEKIKFVFSPLDNVNLRKRTPRCDRLLGVPNFLKMCATLRPFARFRTDCHAATVCVFFEKCAPRCDRLLVKNVHHAATVYTFFEAATGLGAAPKAWRRNGARAAD